MQFSGVTAPKCVAAAVIDRACVSENDSGERDGLRFHSTHRETRHRPMRLIGDRTKLRVIVGNQLVTQGCLERLNIKVAQAAEANLVRHAVGHHNQEWLDLLIGEKVIHDQAGVALNAPSILVFAVFVLQVKRDRCIRSDDASVCKLREEGTGTSRR